MRIEDIAQEMLDEFIDSSEKYPKIKRLENVESIGSWIAGHQNIGGGAKKGCAMVIMGSQGRTGLEHILLGSKAEQVVRLCPLTVTIVKRHA